MWLIVASRYDRDARWLAQTWADRGVCLLTCQDLSTDGWQHSLAADSGGTLSLQGRVIPTADLRGVLTRLPGVTEAELPQIAAGDRPYVAAEMTAFLSAWLTALPCPVLNRPSPTYLLGPAWRSLQWTQAAARAGLPVYPWHQHLDGRSLPPEPPAITTAVTVVGSRYLGTPDATLGQQALDLAALAGVQLLTVRFAGSAFVSADLTVDLSGEAVTEAIWNDWQGA